MKNIGFPFDFEDSYAHGKRLKFIIKAIEDYYQESQREKRDIEILDIGCGTGIGITFPIASLGYNIIGVDIDKDSVDWANQENIYPNAKFECGFLENLPRLSDFDVIICSEVLEHVPNPQRFLLELKTRLKKDGIIVLTVPNGYGWFELEQFISNKLGLKYLARILIKLRVIPTPKKPILFTTLNKNDRHLQRFSYKKIKQLFRRTAVIIVNQRGAALFGGQITEMLFWWCKPFLKFNNWLGDKIPLRFVIDWYFILK